MSSIRCASTAFTGRSKRNPPSLRAAGATPGSRRTLRLEKIAGVWNLRPSPRCTSWCGCSVADVVPVERDLPAGVASMPADHVDQRRLAGAIRPDQEPQLARLQTQAQTIEHADTVEADADVLHLEDAASPSRRRPSRRRAGRRAGSRPARRGNSSTLRDEQRAHAVLPQVGERFAHRGLGGATTRGPTPRRTAFRGRRPRPRSPPGCRA